MATIAEAFTLALRYRDAGKPQEAEQLCRQIVQVDASHAGALHLLGLLAYQAGRYGAAVAHLSQGVAVKPAEAALHVNLGLAYQAQGRLADAAACYQQALRLQPTCAEAHYNLAATLADQGKPEQAAASYREALRLQPDNAAIPSDLGIVLTQLGRLDEAVASLQQALRLKPDYVEGHTNLGIVLARQGKLDEAVACYRQALRYNPDCAEALNSLGCVLRDQEQLDQAIACHRQALRIKPSSAKALNNLGIALRRRGDLDEALASYWQALLLEPSSAEIHHNLANVFREQDKLDEAVRLYTRTLRLKSDFAEAWNDLGGALRDQGKPAKAVPCFHHALRLKPDFAEAHGNLAVTLSDLGQVEEALASCQRALHFKPDNAEARLTRGLICLLQGDFQRGWPEYEWRLQGKSAPLRPANLPLWDGTPLAGRTIVLQAEQGLGDTLQFIRYASLVQQRGGIVFVECPEPLLPLLATSPGIDHLIAPLAPVLGGEGSGVRGPSHAQPAPPHCYAPLLSLPGILGTTAATIPAEVPYLAVDPTLAHHWRRQLGADDLLKIGIAWKGNPRYPGDRQRSAAPEHFAPLTRLEGIRLVSLQKGATTPQLACLAGPCPVADVGNRLRHFADTAAVIVNLDLVITVDTAVAHCAGAFGVPAWVALPFAPDWRWQQQREDSPWYPSLRLFRQAERGQWSAVFERMAGAVEAHLRGAATPHKP